jgi:hypothetical protein
MATRPGNYAEGANRWATIDSRRWVVSPLRQVCRDTPENSCPLRKPTEYEESPSQPIGQLALDVFRKRLGLYQADGESGANGGDANDLGVKC